MANVVGARGQVVIAKEIRDGLGVKPGWLALQRLVDDHVEVFFVPPEHRKSLKGSLAKHTKLGISPGDEWEQARNGAWKKAAEERASFGESGS